MADHGERFLLDARDLARELLAEVAQVREVDGDPGLLHLDEHVDERQLDVAVEPFEIEPLELDGELLAKARRGDRAGPSPSQTLVERRCAVRILAVRDGQRGHLELEPLRREVLERVITAARVDQIARDHRVHRKTPEVRARAAERAAGGLRIVRGLRDGVVKQELHDRRGNAVGCSDVPGAFARGEA